MRTWLAAVFLLAAGPLTAKAADCAAAQRLCLAQCDQAYPASRDDMGHTGCAARCGWDATACSAQSALDDTSAAFEHDLMPWLSDQAGKWQRFLDGFRGTRPAAPPPARSEPERGIPL